MSIRPLLFVPLIVLLGSCSTYFKTQQYVQLQIDSDVPMDVWNDDEVLGSTDEYLKINLYGSRKFEWYLKVENTVVDTVHLRRRLPIYNKAVIGTVVLVPLYTGSTLRESSGGQIPFGTAYVASMAPLVLIAGVDRLFDPYPWDLPMTSIATYAIPDAKVAEYQKLVAEVNEADRKANERVPATELTTVDYMPQALRAKFGLSAIPLSAPSATNSGSVNPTISGTPGSTAASDPEVRVQLKNTSTTAIRVYASVEKSWVVRGQSTLSIDAPAGAKLFLAKSSRPLVLESIAVVPKSGEPQLIIDLVQAKSAW
jgi:hypothetical protein